jgi:carbonic anhydrase
MSPVPPANDEEVPAMRQLLHGMRYFQHKVFPSLRDRFEKLATGQQPRTLFITCSDSRIVPELVTQTGPGDLFVLRNAGNLVPPWTAEHTGEAATIEYAVQVLKVREIVVCGHSHCGAIGALLQPESLEGLPAVRRWLAHAEKTRHEIAELEHSFGAGTDRLTAGVQANVRVQIGHLRTFPAVAERESRGDLALVGCYYQFETGDVSVLDEATGKFSPALDALTRELSIA